MWVGMGRVVLDFHGNQDAAKKQREIDEFCTALRKQLQVSAREVADHDDPERCVIGVALVMPESWTETRAENAIDSVMEKIDQTAFARVTVEDFEIFEFGREDFASDEAPYSESELKQFRKGPSRFTGAPKGTKPGRRR